MRLKNDERIWYKYMRCMYEAWHHLHAVLETVFIKGWLQCGDKSKPIVAGSSLLPDHARRGSRDEVLVVFFGLLDDGLEDGRVSEKIVPSAFESGPTMNRR
jgi:hypothetical protein